jgi:hypothetical protein
MASSEFEFSEGELRDPLRAAKRLILAAQDMGDAAEAATELDVRHGSRVLETALVVSYARPWTASNSIEPLGEQWLPSGRQDEGLHFDLMRLRDKLYAHTDEEFGARGVADVRHLVGAAQIMLVPSTRTIKAEVVSIVREMANAQRERFREAAEQLSRSVRRFTVEVRWLPQLPREIRGLLLDELESELFMLHPTSVVARDDFAVELEVIDPAPTDGDFEYGMRRLARAVKQWHRRLIPLVPLGIVIGEHVFLIPTGGAEMDIGARWTHEGLLARYRSCPAGVHVWADIAGEWRDTEVADPDSQKPRS